MHIDRALGCDRSRSLTENRIAGEIDRVPQEPSQSGGKEETISRLHTTILESFGSSHKFSDGSNSRTRRFTRAKTPRTPSPEVKFLCGPFDVAQDMLCAFARDIPSFGCGFAALSSS